MKRDADNCEINPIFAANYNDKTKKRNMTRIYLCIVSLLLLIYACSNDLESIGQDIVDNNNYIGSELVTVLNTATIRLDSFPTSSGTWGSSSSGSSVPKYIIVGKYDEPHGGTTTAVPCFQLDIPSDLGSPSFNAALDSAVFCIHLGSKIWGDTTYNIKSQGYNIYRLKELPEIVYSPTFNDYFYNISPVDYDRDSLIGRLEFLPKVEHINKAWTRVNDNLAERMFYEMKFRSGKDSYYANTYAFRNFFKGLAIVPDETNDCLISLNAQDSLFMRFFYHDNGAERTTTFKVSRSEFLYNQYLTDRTDSPFAALESQRDEVYLRDVDFALCQGLSGYATTFTLPYPIGMPRYSTLLKVQLEVKVEYYTNNPIDAPASLYLYELNKTNDFMGRLQNTSSDVVGTPQESGGENERYYIFDMTEYYQNVIDRYDNTQTDVAIVLPEITSSYDYIVVKEEPVVRFYYANYKQ